MDKIISVVVPIYNVKEYLDKCINSISNQTYANLEIFLINDGSTDGGEEIASQWSKKDNRIKLINQENGGLSSARNIGINLANGEYILFIDGDDYIEPNMIQTLYELCIKYNAGIAECEWNKVDEKTNIQNSTFEPIINTFTSEEALEENIKDNYFKQTVVNKLYKTCLIKTEQFPIGKTNEDEFWSYKILGKAKILVHTNEVLYHYVQREGSIINSEYSIKRLDGVEAKKERMEYVKENYPLLFDKAKLSYVSACKYAYQKISMMTSLDCNKTFRKYLHEEFKKYFIYPQNSLKQKIWYKMFYLYPNFTSNLRNKFKIGL